MKKLTITLSMIIAIFMVACDKDQKAVENIADGQWTVTKFTDDDGDGVFDEFDSWTGTASFNECAQKDGDCTGAMNFTANNSQEIDMGNGTTETHTLDVEMTMNFTYNTAEKGTEINVSMVDFTTKSTSTFQGATQSETTTETCTDSCSAPGVINADYSEITINPDEGGQIIMKKM